MQANSQTKRKPRQTKRKPRAKWNPPRGIRVYFREDRRSAWVVQWRPPNDSKLVSKSFASEQDQIRFAKRLAKRRDDEGNMILNFEPKKWQRFLQFEEKIGGIENLDAVERFWLESGIQAGGMELKEAGKLFLESKGREAIALQSYERYRYLMERLERSFPNTHLMELSPDVLTGWIESLRLPNGQPVAAITRNNWRKHLNTFFNFCVRKHWVNANPIDAVDRWGTVEKPVGILTPEEGRKLFEANWDLSAVGRLALEAFGGLRYSSAKRLVKKNINFEDLGISLPAGSLKTGKRFYVDSFPENLWLWLEYAPEECWTMKPRQYQEAKRHAFIRAGIPHPRNCLRHSFATYHVSKLKNVGETATILCHTNLSMLNRHYRGMATHRQGLEWFEIRP